MHPRERPCPCVVFFLSTGAGCKSASHAQDHTQTLDNVYRTSAGPCRVTLGHLRAGSGDLTVGRHASHPEPDCASGCSQLPIVGKKRVDPVLAVFMGHERAGQVKSIQRAHDRRVGLTCTGEECGGYPDAMDGLPERGEPLMQKAPLVIVQVGTEAEPVDRPMKLDPADLAGVCSLPASPSFDRRVLVEQLTQHHRRIEGRRSSPSAVGQQCGYPRNRSAGRQAVEPSQRLRRFGRLVDEQILFDGGYQHGNALAIGGDVDRGSRSLHPDVGADPRFQLRGTDLDYDHILTKLSYGQ